MAFSLRLIGFVTLLRARRPSRHPLSRQSSHGLNEKTDQKPTPYVGIDADGAKTLRKTKQNRPWNMGSVTGVGMAFDKEERQQSGLRIEWPTLGLIIAIYAAWLAVTFWSAALPSLFTIILGSIILAWHSSLQHEILHGHPTSSRVINRALATPPLSLWLPYELYRRAHLTHHRDERLTDPLDDPESWYFTAEQWNDLSRPVKLLFAFQNTFVGRMLIGPALAVIGFLYSEMKNLALGDFKNLGLWVRHIIGIALVMYWVTVICEMSAWFYIFGMVYPGTALLLVRSFAEHRAADNVHERTAIVENATFFGPLFLYNNLHSAHHEKPTMAWYEIPAWYKANRERLIAENHGHIYNGYFDVIRRYLFTAHHEPRHPTNRAPRADGTLPAQHHG